MYTWIDPGRKLIKTQTSYLFVMMKSKLISNAVPSQNLYTVFYFKYSSNINFKILTY